MSVTNERPIVQEFIIEVLKTTADVAADVVLATAELIGNLFSSSEPARQAEMPPPSPARFPSLESRVRGLFEAVGN